MEIFYYGILGCTLDVENHADIAELKDIIGQLEGFKWIK